MNEKMEQKNRKALLKKAMRILADNGVDDYPGGDTVCKKNVQLIFDNLKQCNHARKILSDNSIESAKDDVFKHILLLTAHLVYFNTNIEESTKLVEFKIKYTGDNVPSKKQIRQALIEACIDDGGMLEVKQVTSKLYTKDEITEHLRRALDELM